MMLGQFRQDLLFACRSLRRSPLFTSAALLTLSLGVGITAATFSVVNGVLLKPLPFPDQDRIITIGLQWNSRPEGIYPMSAPDIEDLAKLPVLEAAVGHAVGSDVLAREGVGTLLSSTRLTSGILAPFGLQPFLGRDLTSEDAREGSNGAVLLSHPLWVEEFGADPGILGRILDLNGEAYEVVGVAPPGFDYPGGSQIWRPSITSPDCQRGCRLYQATGRLAPSTTLEHAILQIRSLGVRLAREFPESNTDRSFRPRSLKEELVGGVREELWVLMGAVALVLLVACANVANLLLARGQGRSGEMGLRASLGANKGRLVRQLLTESLVLASAGGAGGLCVAWIISLLLRRLASGNIPRIAEVGMDGTVALFTLATVFVVALLFGLSPAIRLTRSTPAGNLRSAGRGGAGQRPGNRIRKGLLAAELAVSMILLVGTGLLLRTLYRIHEIQPGFRVENVMRFSLMLPESRYPELVQASLFFGELEGRIGALPGVSGIGSIYGAPLGAWGTSGSVLVRGRPVPEPGNRRQAYLRPVTPGYLEAMDIPVLRGRDIESTDVADTRPVALVNETFAEMMFPEEEPLGQGVRITVDMGFGSPTFTVVGVVEDARTRGVTRAPPPEVFVPQAQMGPRAMTVVVHSTPGHPLNPSSIREIMGEMDPLIPIRRLETMNQVMSRETAHTTFYLSLLSAFAGLAVILSSIGLYGVVAYLVSTRRQEIGIRVALGASREGIMKMVLKQGIRPALMGIGLGLGLAMAGARIFQGFLYQVDPRDPLVLIAACILLAGVAALASFLPTRQALQVDPIQALRPD